MYLLGYFAIEPSVVQLGHVVRTLSGEELGHWSNAIGRRFIQWHDAPATDHVVFNHEPPVVQVSRVHDGFSSLLCEPLSHVARLLHFAMKAVTPGATTAPVMATGLAVTAHERDHWAGTAFRPNLIFMPPVTGASDSLSSSPSSSSSAPPALFLRALVSMVSSQRTTLYVP